MSDATEEFFEELGRRGHEPLVAKISGRVRFDVVDGRRTDSWLVAIDKGDIAVSRGGTDDEHCTVRADKALFDRLANGEENAMAATLRGALVCTGDVDLLLAVQRFFPGPPRASVPRVGSGIAMNGKQVRILDGNTFVVSDERGDIEASLTDPTGLFSFDTRFLSKWILSVNGQRLTPLSVDDLQYFETRFFLVPGTGTVYIDSKLSVIRHRTIGNGFQEQLTFLNHEQCRSIWTIRIDADCDFADLFEVKDALPKRGTFRERVEKNALVLAYRARDVRTSDADPSSEPCGFDENGLTFEVRLEPQATWTTTLQIATDLGADDRPCEDAPSLAWHAKRARTHMAAEPGALDRARTTARVGLGAVEGDLQAEPRRSRRAAVLAPVGRTPHLAGCGAALVHDDVRPRQHLHQPAGASVRARNWRRRRCASWA